MTVHRFTIEGLLSEIAEWPANSVLVESTPVHCRRQQVRPKKLSSLVFPDGLWLAEPDILK